MSLEHLLLSRHPLDPKTQNSNPPQAFEIYSRASQMGNDEAQYRLWVLEDVRKRESELGDLNSKMGKIQQVHTMSFHPRQTMSFYSNKETWTTLVDLYNHLSRIQGSISDLNSKMGKNQQVRQRNLRKRIYLSQRGGVANINVDCTTSLIKFGNCKFSG